ncbi:hypothetical protein KSP40_PGU017631 [Platanthera guangdongensis]|uniref:TRAF-type domain-containing protein n=1 Tax=Platanthera guangdongensis TaxID=2320717 RepID=A0ABR2N0L8_9ASPA
MDLPVSDLAPIKDAVASFSCSHCDAEAVHKVAQVLLPGLATACIDSTAGDFFRTPAFVAVDLRKEMVDYLNLRSETYISNLLLLAQASPDAPDLPPDEPADIVADLIEDFAASKRNILSRVSGWILSDSREDKIDEFVHEMETNRFWMIDRREAVAEILLRNLDYKNESHCSMRFEDEGQLVEHMGGCTFRPVGCANEGCKVKFSALHAEHHDSVCAYKVLPCDQKCPEMIMRREMDRHCVTVCRMKLMNCPFYQVGCRLPIPQCMLEQHCRDQLQTHMISVLPLVHRGDERSEDDWRERAEALEKVFFPFCLSSAMPV